MTVQASCHCGAVRLILPEPPREVVACDCSLCSRRGMLWAHYGGGEVATDGFTEDYSWGDRTICFCHCPKCGCTTHWQSNTEGERAKMGVNARLIDGFTEDGGGAASRYSFGGAAAEMRLLQGANG